MVASYIERNTKTLWILNKERQEIFEAAKKAGLQGSKLDFATHTQDSQLLVPLEIAQHFENRVREIISDMELGWRNLHLNTETEEVYKRLKEAIFDSENYGSLIECAQKENDGENTK